MGKIYTIIYLIIFVVILIVLLMQIKTLTKALPIINKMSDTANNMTNNLNKMAEKGEYINSVNNKIFTSNTKKIFAGFILVTNIFNDYKNAKKKPLRYAIKKAFK